MASVLKFEEERLYALTLLKEGADLKDFHFYIHGLKEFMQQEYPNTILPVVMETICEEFDERFNHIVL